MDYEVYQTTPEKHGRGTFFFTSCGHQMYSVRDARVYHGCLCSGCFSKGKQTTLYIIGSKEAKEKCKSKYVGGLK